MAKAGKSTRAAAAVAATQSIMGANEVIAIGKDRQVQIGGSDSLAVKVDEVITVGGAFTLSVGKDATLGNGGVFSISATKVRLRATQELRLEVGSSLIVLKPNGDIQIKGNRIDISGSGEVHLKGSKVLTN